MDERLPGKQTRTRILVALDRLRKETPDGVSVTQLAQNLAMTGPPIARNMRILVARGHVALVGKRGKHILYVRTHQPTSQPREDE